MAAERGANWDDEETTPVNRKGHQSGDNSLTRQPTLILLKFFDLFGILLGRPHFHKNRTDTVQMIKDGAIWVNI